MGKKKYYTKQSIWFLDICVNNAITM